jgi:hypothetical protein
LNPLPELERQNGTDCSQFSSTYIYSSGEIHLVEQRNASGCRRHL